MTTRGVNPATASPAARDRASFFPDPRRRSNACKKPLPAFQRAATCPKPTARYAYDHYTGNDQSLTRSLTGRDARLVHQLIDSADLIDVRDIVMHDPEMEWGTPRRTAFLLVALPEHMLDALAEFRATLEDFEEGSDIEGETSDREAGSWSELAWSRGRPTSSQSTGLGAVDDGYEGEALEQINQERRADGEFYGDCEATAVECEDQRQRTDGRSFHGDTDMDDDREPENEHGGAAGPSLEAVADAKRRIAHGVGTDPQGVPRALTWLEARS
jgi:hypothetical protein